MKPHRTCRAIGLPATDAGEVPKRSGHPHPDSDKMVVGATAEPGEQEYPNPFAACPLDQASLTEAREQPEAAILERALLR